MTSGSDIAFASAGALVELYRKKALSPLEAADMLLGRAEALQPRLNAFCFLDRDGALAAARASEQRWRTGAPLSAIDGVPVTIKDIVLMRGFPTLRGSKLIDPDQDWSEDSPAVAPLNLGTDGAGSIRIPAAFTGIFGIKATFGRVPAYPASPLGLLSNVGPMTRHVRDAALMLNVLSRPDHRDPYALPPEGRNWLDGIDGGVRGLKIAYSPDLGYARVDPEIAAACADAARQFEALGAKVEEVGEIFPSPRDVLLTLWAAGEARVLAGFPAEKHHLCDPGLAAMAALGDKISSVDYLGADVARTMLGVRMGEFHERYDLLLTPMMPVPALPVGRDLNDAAQEEQWWDWSPFSYPFNMTRQPAASIPCGLTSAGLPIGLQIVGPLYAEDRVLRAARAFETTQPERRPPLFAT